MGDYAVECDIAHGSYFNSMHEAWGVSTEELTEFLDELHMSGGLFELYKKFQKEVMHDDYSRMVRTLKNLETRSFKAMMELAQFIYCVQKAYITLEASDIEPEEDKQ